MAYPQEYEALSDKLLAADPSKPILMNDEEMGIYRTSSFKGYHEMRVRLSPKPPERPLTYEEARTVAIALRDGFIQAIKGLEKIFNLGKQ